MRTSEDGSPVDLSINDVGSHSRTGRIFFSGGGYLNFSFSVLVALKPGVAHTTYDGCNVLNNLKTVHSDQGVVLCCASCDTCCRPC